MDHMDDENLSGGFNDPKTRDISSSFQDCANPTGFLGDPGEERVSSIMSYVGHLTVLLSRG